MPIESANFVSGLNSAYPAGTDQRSTADDHLRLIKTVLAKSFNSHSAPVALVPVTDTGAVNAAVVTLNPAPSQYYTGQLIVFWPVITNTGAMTINVNALGVKSIVDMAGNALVGDMIALGAPAIIIYDGTNFVLINSAKQADAGINAIAALVTAADKMLYWTGEDAPALTSLTGFARTLLAAADAAAARLVLGTTIGIDVQAYDADIPTVAASTAEMQAGTVTSRRSMSPKNVAEAIAAQAGSGQVEIANFQPTSDISTTPEWTGCSNYKRVELIGAVQIDAGFVHLILECRSSGGTWRSLGQMSVETAASTSTLSFHITIMNSDVAAPKVVTSYSAVDADGIVDTNSANNVSDASASCGAFPSWSEIWDGVRLKTSSSFIEGGAGSRGRILVIGTN